MSASNYPTLPPDPLVRPPPGAPVVPRHVARPARSQGGAELSSRVAAQLDSFLGDEGAGVAAILEGLDLRGARADLEALRILHTDWSKLDQPLIEAEHLLEELLEAFAEIPSRAQFGWPLPEALRDSAAYLDTAICWYGARVEDLLKVVRRARCVA